MAGIRINSNNFNGESVEITFNPFSGGTIDLGTQTIPYDYVSSNYEGNYSIFIPSANKTCPLQVGVAPTPTPSPTQTNTPTPTSSSTATPTPTLTSTPTPTPSASAPAGDPDANAYLADVVASGGTTNPTIEAAVQTLFTDLKSAGLYSKMDLMYPFVGSTAGSHAINALGNKTYDITWYGGMTHGISGSTGNGSNGWADLTFSLNDLTDRTLGSWGMYITQQNTNNGAHGNFDADRTILQPYRTTSTNTYCFMKTPSPAIGVPPIVDGNHTIVRTGTTEFAVYINETQYTTALGYNSSPVTSIMSLFVFTANGSPVTSLHSNDTLGFCYFASDIDYNETATLQGIINTFQTSLGRNTY